MKLKLCHACRGAKTLLGIGMMVMEKCSACCGSGYVPDIDDKELDDILYAVTPAIMEVVNEPVAAKPAVKAGSKAKRPSKGK